MKFADDSALLSLLFGSQQDHGPALRNFVKWCDDFYRKFNVCKIKESVIDVRKHSQSPGKTTIRDQEVEIVTKYKYLGTVFDNKLRWDDNTEVIVKKYQQRLYFLRKLNSFSVDKTILNLFYKSFIECFFVLRLSTGILTWRVIIGETQIDITQFCEQQVLRKTRSILADDSHALYPLSDTLVQNKP